MRRTGCWSAPERMRWASAVEVPLAGAGVVAASLIDDEGYPADPRFFRGARSSWPLRSGQVKPAHGS
jgi:hypothetical protein